MFLRSLTSSDPRFKPIHFHDGLNILVAEKAQGATQGDSRNSTGKTSLVKLIRYVLGGSLDKRLNKAPLFDHSFSLALEIPKHEQLEIAEVTRQIKPSTKVQVSGLSALRTSGPMAVEEWRAVQGELLFSIPDGVARPTAGQIWGQFARTFFDSPVKTFSNESAWESGARLGYLLGLSPEVLNKAGDLEKLKKQRDAVKLVSEEKTLSGFNLDEAGIRSELASVRQQRDSARSSLQDFTVDKQYAEHQELANKLSAEIQLLNDRLLALSRRKLELDSAIYEQSQSQTQPAAGAQLLRAFEEAGAILPDLVVKRFDDVVAFHSSIVENRRHYLAEELRVVETEVSTASLERTGLDVQRSQALRLLRDSVAIDTFIDAQRSLTQIEMAVVDLERQLETATTYNETDNSIKLQRAETVATLRAEVSEQSELLETPIALFRRLGDEIYSDRRSDLRIASSSAGALKVEPVISGDASTGILGVETFLLDIVSLVQGLSLGRAPRLLIHDSHNFDATDHRQVASCLNIGARLAHQYGFQYVVTMNSDFLASVESEGAFDSSGYLVETRLSDATDDGGLFGFRFD
jgi:uncharacterized protein YydD (DUF2326 family)